MKFSRRREGLDMTQGPIAGQLVRFAVPLLLGFLFQQLYNMVDSVVVGNFVGKEALASVGSTQHITNTLIGFFMGLSIGANVVIARMFGARDSQGLSKAVHTTMLLTLIMSALFTVVGTLYTPLMLRLMKTPEDVFEGSKSYLRIIFAGVTGQMIYNMGAGVLRAVGDSRRPLYFLIFSALVNIAGDLIFVLAFGLGVAGVAYATILSQCLSAALVVVVLMRASGAHRLELRKLRIDPPTLRSIFKIGLPAAIQSAITSFSNVFVQSYINAFGSACMAGWTIYGKLDMIAVLPMQSISMANSTFVGQNLGAGNIERAKKGVRTSIALAMTCTAVMIIPLEIFPRPLLSFFNRDSEVLSYGVMFLRFISPFYIITCISDLLAGALRGAGESKAPMAFMLGSYVVFRQIYLYVMSRLTTSALLVGAGYPFGWCLCAVLHILYYRYSRWEERQEKVLGG